jgi:hypothetical protein
VASSAIRDQSGRRVVVVTASESAETPVGWLGVMVGDTFETAGTRIYFLEHNRGRLPTAREQTQTRAPYDPSSTRRQPKRTQVDDDHLAEPEAIELARIEQEREPADLMNG